MIRILKWLAWAMFAGTAYLILTGAVGYWIKLPGLGNIGFTVVFVLFSVLHCTVCNGWKKTGAFFLVSGVISYALEEIGVRSSWIYGAYHYSGMLGPKLGHVPFLIPLAWFMMIYPSWMLARALLRGVDLGSGVGMVAQAIIAAMVMTAWDTVMDPGMAAAGAWVWEQGGPYFGVPLRNYAGWLLTTFLVYMVAGLLWRDAQANEGISKAFAGLPIMVYALFALSYATPRRIPALEIVALFTMVMPSLAGLMQFWFGVGPDSPRRAYSAKDLEADDAVLYE